MSLATRCTACGTAFRVVQDQLKVADGWVRCGRCQEVFSARGVLFDLERDGVPQPAGPDVASAGDAGATAGEGAFDDGDCAVAGEPAPTDAAAEVQAAAHDTPGEELRESPPRPPDMADIETQTDATGGATPDETAAPVIAAPGPSLANANPVRLFPPRRESSATPADGVAERDRLDFMDARFNVELLAEEMADSEERADPLADPAADESVHAPDEGDEAPGFVRQAERQARRNSLGMRVVLSLVALALLLALALQAAHHHRDLLAARWPAAQPLLAQWCAHAGCRVQAPRGIADIVVESTALTQIGQSAQTMRLDVMLRNRGALARKTPSVDLSLSDTNGRLVARRMLAPSDFRVAPSVIGPGTEATLTLTLAASHPVSGYTVELFYP